MSLLRTLKPGDVLLYKPKGFFGWVIRVKTWHQIAHVECYVGDGLSVASRDGKGVGKYPLRSSELAVVCRPKPEIALNWKRAMAWYETQKGTPYGWADLLQFAGIAIDADGIVCSPFATRFCRRLGYDPFNGEDANKIAPFQFELSNCYDIYEVDTNGQVLRRNRQVSADAS
jgi:hypothetical protein